MTASQTLTLGIDIGGTNVKLGLCNADGAIRARESMPTHAERGAPDVARRAAEILPRLLDAAGARRESILAAGVGAPGPLDHRTGIVFEAPNLPGWRNVPLAQLFAHALQLHVQIENDANAAAYGEHLASDGPLDESMVLLTLGTGLGGGVVLGGQLLRGDHSSAGEIGHLIIEPSGRPCPCGQRGCLERYVSATAVIARYHDAGGSGGISQVPELVAAAGRDPIAGKIWDETARYLALGCINLMRLFDVSRIVLGGGVSNAGETLLRPTREHVAKLNWRMTNVLPVLDCAKLGEDAGIVGNAMLARAAIIG